MSVYDTLDILCEKVESLDPQTFAYKSKDMNKELENILTKIQQMREIDYDKNKIDFLYEMVNKALEQGGQVEILIERLQALEKIHKESPNIAQSII